MSNPIRFTVYGNPVGKQAAKAFFNPKSKTMHKFSPKKTTDWEQLIRSVAQEYVPEKLLDGPLAVESTFYLTKPPSRPKKCRYPDRKPDHDNLEKALYDALEGVIYKNDSRIVDKIFRKRWGDPPRVEVVIRVKESKEDLDNKYQRLFSGNFQTGEVTLEELKAGV